MPGPPTASVFPCACANLRRAARAVTRLYNAELKPTGLEATQFAVLMALRSLEQATQGKLGRVLALDSTSLTRMLVPLISASWVGEKPGQDRRQRLLSLTPMGKRKLLHALPFWEEAQRKLQVRLKEPAWTQLPPLLAAVTEAAD